jgi:uncharacterized membrane-anchored protein
MSRNDRINLGTAAIVSLFEPDADKLRVSPAEAADILEAMVVGLCSPLNGTRPNVAPEMLVDLILHGIARDPMGGPRGERLTASVAVSGSALSG